MKITEFVALYGKKKKKKAKKMKKIIIKKEANLYVKKGPEVSAYCDFCGCDSSPVFESEWESPTSYSKDDMQICFNCVKQLNKFI